MSNTEYKTSLEPVVCATCGILFGVEGSYKQVRLKDGDYFKCPNGHGNKFSDNIADKVTKLTERITELEKELEESKVENRRLKCELLKLAPTEHEKKSLLQRIGLT